MGFIIKSILFLSFHYKHFRTLWRKSMMFSVWLLFPINHAQGKQLSWFTLTCATNHILSFFLLLLEALYDKLYCKYTSHNAFIFWKKLCAILHNNFVIYSFGIFPLFERSFCFCTVNFFTVPFIDHKDPFCSCFITFRLFKMLTI